MRLMVCVALIAYLAFAVPHFVFHLAHLHDASSGELAFLVICLGGTLLLPMVLLALAPRAVKRVPQAE